MFRRCGLLFLVLVMLCPCAAAQNVTGYQTMPNPILFLLREPAFQKELKLSESQLSRLIELNESMDAQLLGSRANKSPEESQRMANEVMEKTLAVVSELFNEDQIARTRQIRYRLRGISFVLQPEAVEALELSQEQQDTILAAVTEANKKVKEVSSSEFQGREAEAKSRKLVLAARKEEQETILGELNGSQKQTLSELIGEPFEIESLGQAIFKAPELIDSGEWINTDGLKISDLRGKVVALHFFAYG